MSVSWCLIWVNLFESELKLTNNKYFHSISYKFPICHRHGMPCSLFSCMYYVYKENDVGLGVLGSRGKQIGKFMFPTRSFIIRGKTIFEFSFSLAILFHFSAIHKSSEGDLEIQCKTPFVFIIIKWNQSVYSSSSRGNFSYSISADSISADMTKISNAISE